MKDVVALFYGDGGLKYFGEVECGLEHGYGRSFKKGGILDFEGEFRKGKRHGIGREFQSGHSIFREGVWEEGEFVVNLELSVI